MKVSRDTRRWGLMALLAAGAATAMAQTGGDELAALTAKVAELEAAAGAAQSAGDNAWILTSSALVLMMTAPGLILFYGGLVRAKNMLSILMQGLFLMGIVSVVWLTFGYSVAFGEMPGTIGRFVGNPLQYKLLDGVGQAPAAHTVNLPHLTFMFFQLMFAIITPALIVGAFAERFRFKAFVPFIILWLVIVYLPLAHMVWGPNGFLNAFVADNKFKALDFAGGTVVHISSGISALVCCIYIGKRDRYPGPQFVPHNLVWTVVGAGLLWVGWFGFNAGSALGANGLASAAFASTHFSAAGATVSWIAAEWLLRGKPSVLGAASGAVAGLVAVTPAAGFVTPAGGLVIGLIGGVVCYLATSKLKGMLGYDDSLDVFGVHGVGGILGAVLTGVFATKEVQDVFGGGNVGLIEGNAGQVVNQVVAVAITAVLAVVGTTVLLFLVDKTIGIRPSREDEETGLDITDHGEQAYHSV